MKQLIINADDLGMNPQRSHGIFQAFEFGVVSSASIIPNMSHSDQAAKHAREREVPCGLHLNLTEGTPVSDRAHVESLLEGNGEFRDRQQQRRMLAEGAVDPTHIEREIRAQIEWFLDAHGQPTHVDGHHHIHIHPLIAPLLVDILDRYGILHVRIPAEHPLPPFGYIVSDEQIERAKKITAEAEEARKLFTANGLTGTDHFRGLSLIGNASAKNLRHNLNRLPEGSTELMVHPSSHITVGTEFDLDPQRQTELLMLLNPELPGFIKERGIQLCSWADIA